MTEPSGFDRIAEREQRRVRARRRLARMQFAAGIFAAAEVVLAFTIGPRWLLGLAAVATAGVLAVEWVRRRMDALNDLRFDWYDRQTSHTWRVLWRGWDEPPPGKK